MPSPATLDQYGPRRPRKDLVHHSAGNLLLSCDAIRAQERMSYVPEVGEPDVPEADRHNYGGVHR